MDVLIIMALGKALDATIASMRMMGAGTITAEYALRIMFLPASIAPLGEVYKKNFITMNLIAFHMKIISGI